MIRTGTPTLPNQSYLVKQMQAKMTAALSVLMYDLGAACFNPPHPWQNPNSVLTYTSGWRREHQNFVITGSPFPNVTFTGARWDPENGKVNYGLKKVAKDAVKQDDGLTKIIRNDTDGDIHVSYSQAISLTNSFSSSITKGLNEDLEVSSETTVSGSYAGVSAEEKLGVSFGIEKTSEESKEESQEGTRDEALAIDFDATAGLYYLITILKEQGNFYQDFDIDAVQDFDVRMNLNTKTWHTRRNGRRISRPDISVRGGVEGLLQFVHGFDTDHPHMQGYWDVAPARVKAAVNWIADPVNRRIQVSGRNQGTLDKNADFHVELLGNGVPDPLAHLPVENALGLSG